MVGNSESMAKVGDENGDGDGREGKGNVWRKFILKPSRRSGRGGRR